MKPKKYTYISLDIWDTLLQRQCHPDEVKLFTAQYTLFILSPYVPLNNISASDLFQLRKGIEFSIGLSEKANGFDDEYEIKDVFDTLLKEITRNTLESKTRDRLADQLIAAEIEQEIAVSYLNPGLAQILSPYKSAQIILTSDFYMAADKIEKILNSKQIPWAFEAIFTSCDSKVNKRSGRLYQYICKTLKTSPESVLHIGDNEVSDVLMARQSGIDAFHFTPGNNMINKRGKKISRRYTEKNVSATLVPYPLDIQQNTVRAGTGQQMYEEGMKLSASFLGFALFIRQVCESRQHKRIFFCTREGIFFKKIFDTFQKQNPYRLEPLATTLLPVSRLSTFFPSLQHITPTELRRMWSQYDTQSIHTLFSSLGLNHKDFQTHLDRNALDPDVRICCPWQDTRIQALFKDQQFLCDMYHLHSEQKLTLKSYLQSIDFDKDPKAMVIDIGWRGTIQDNLALIFGQLEIDGIYIGLQKFFNRQPDNTQKWAFLANENSTEHHPALLHVIPIEMLCFSPGGSTISYQKNDNDIFPEYKVDDEEEQYFLKWIAPFQEGVLNGVSSFCTVIQEKGISVEELRELGRKQLAELIEDPSPILCQAFFALKQDDTFGMSRVLYPSQNRYRLRDKIQGYIRPDKKKQFLNSLEQSGWPQALLRSQYGGFLYYLSKMRRRIT